MEGLIDPCLWRDSVTQDLPAALGSRGMTGCRRARRYKVMNHNDVRSLSTSLFSLAGCVSGPKVSFPDQCTRIKQRFDSRLKFVKEGADRIPVKVVTSTLVRSQRMLMAERNRCLPLRILALAVS